MSPVSASFDQWWNGVSLRAKITGVTVLLLTFGLTVAGAGTMTVLRTYLLERVDAELLTEYSELDTVIPFQMIQDFDEVDSGNTPFYIAAVSASGRLIDDNLSTAQADLGPDLSRLTLEYVIGVEGGLTLTNEAKTTEWRVVTAPLRVGRAAEQATLVMGLNLNETNAIIARYTLIYFLFALAVVIFGAATTQLLVTSTFAPLRDVEATAARFANGDFAQRLGGATPNTEVGRLNRSLNTMLARIDRAFAERQRAVEQMRRFVGDASHELRTPLVSLRGYAELYRMGAIQKPEDVAQAMDRIEREAIRMGGLVEDLLELARLDEDRPPQLASVDLLPIANDAELDAAASNPSRQIRVVVRPAVPAEPSEAPETAAPRADEAATKASRRGGRGRARKDANGEPSSATGPIAIAGSTWARLRRRRGQQEQASPPPAAKPLPPAPTPDAPGPIVLAEENKIRQVVTNLLGNATRFSPDGSPIEIEVGVDRAGGFGQIAIIDHGEGIPPQLREKIFQRFWRADTSRTRETGGSGLGLAIVAGIVEKHQGHVEVLETPGGGATFRVSLPLVPSAPPAEDSASDGGENAEPAARS